MRTTNTVQYTSINLNPDQYDAVIQMISEASELHDADKIMQYRDGVFSDHISKVEVARDRTDLVSLLSLIEDEDFDFETRPALTEVADKIRRLVYADDYTEVK